MAAACTVSPMRMKLIAFAVSGGIAALAGCLLVTAVRQVQPEAGVHPGGVDPHRRRPRSSAGWARSPARSSARCTCAACRCCSTTPTQVQLLTSSIGLLVLLMYFPGGLMQIVYSLRDAVLAWADRRLGERATPARARRSRSACRPADRAARAVRRSTTPWLAVRERQRAVRRQPRRRPREPRRAGGRDRRADRHERRRQVDADERDQRVRARRRAQSRSSAATSSDVPAYRRHRLGLGRGFQAARLFPALTVSETIMVALEAREQSWLVPSMTGLPPSPSAERRKRAEAAELDRLPRPRPLRRRVRREPVDGHAAHRRARDAARRRRARAAARRADRRRRATRDRGVRPADRAHPARARRGDARHRARHAADDGDQRPRLLPRGRARHRRGHAGEVRNDPASSRRTSAPTSARSSVRGQSRSTGERTTLTCRCAVHRA